MSKPSQRRVVITGLGVVSPLGNSTDELWDALVTGKSGVRPLENLPAQTLGLPVAAEAVDFTGHIDNFGPLEKDQKRAIRKGIKVMCREIQMGVAAAQRALAGAGLKVGDYDCNRTGVVFGSDYILSGPDEFVDAMSSCRDGDKQFAFSRWAADGIPKITPLWLLKYLPNMPASHIAIYNDLRGPSNSLTMREASANAAIGEATHLIARGSADRMIAGATGTRVHAIRTLHVVLQEEVAASNGEPATICRPFDSDRCGMVLGEGAGAVILESLESAQERGAFIFGEVVGTGSSAVVDKRGVGDLRQAARIAMSHALQRAKVDPSEIGHVHAHGLATQRSDAEEAQAIADLFGPHDQGALVTAAKSYFGNTGAAGGAIELISSLLAMQHGKLFPVLNYQTPDPQCPVNVVTEFGMSPGNSVLNVNMTPLGHASTILVNRWSAA